MSPKNILISLNDTKNIDHTLKTACHLARRHDAHLTAVFIIPSVRTMVDYYGSNSVLLDIQNDERDYHKKTANEMIAKFETAMAKSDVRGKAHMVKSPVTDISDTFIEQAMTNDLVLMPQIDPEDDYGLESNFVEKILMGSGRPVLLLPRNKTYENIGDIISIGWNLKPEAARACFDAVPLFAKNSEVYVTWVDAHLNKSSSGDLPGAEIAETLAHYGFGVSSISTKSDDKNIGKALLEDAKIRKSDLLVMGAYGHSRLHEYVFGGATKYILNNMDLPVLMSR